MLVMNWENQSLYDNGKISVGRKGNRRLGYTHTLHSWIKGKLTKESCKWKAFSKNLMDEFGVDKDNIQCSKQVTNCLSKINYMRSRECQGGHATPPTPPAPACKNRPKIDGPPCDKAYILCFFDNPLRSFFEPLLYINSKALCIIFLFHAIIYYFPAYTDGKEISTTRSQNRGIWRFDRNRTPLF